MDSQGSAIRTRRSKLAAAVLAIALSLGAPAVIFAQEAPPAEPAPAEPAAPATAVADVPAPAPDSASDPNGSEPASASGEAAPAPPAEATAAPAALPKGSVGVNMVDFAFSPATVTIDVGDSVTWTNQGEEDHTATGNGFDTGSVSPGASRSVTFQNAGTFNYVCVFHANQRGTVIVRGSGSPQASGDTSGTGAASGDPAAAAPAGSEAAAVASPDAAGTGDSLPATGESEAPLLILGTGLLTSGLLAGVLARIRAREIVPRPPGL